MKFEKNKTIKFSAIVLVIVFFIVCALFVIDSLAPANPRCYDKWLLSAFNGSYDAEGCPKTYWQVEPQKSTQTGERVVSYCKVNLSTTNNRDIKEIWVNISDLKETECKVTIGKGSTKVTVIGSTSISATEVNKSSNGWFKVYDISDMANFESLSTKLIWVGFENDVRVREIVFLDTENKLADSITISGFSIDGNAVTQTNVDQLAKIKDEQTTFVIG